MEEPALRALKEVKHTPGPWFHRPHSDWSDRSKEYLAANPEDSDALDGPPKNNAYWVAHCLGPDREGNARLIAAAPDLLEALKRLVSGWIAQELPHNAFCVLQARDAIAKAEGQTSVASGSSK